MQLETPNFLIATIYKSTGSRYLAKDENGKFWTCRVYGKLKLDDEITSTNPIAVGDIVEIAEENELENGAMILNIKKRKNYIARQSPHNKNQKHIVASNLDQAILLASLKNPKTSTGFIDRFLISSATFHLPAIIIFNKADIYNDIELEEIDMLKQRYEKIGYDFYLISIQEKINLEVIKNLLRNKTTLLCGHSGVGKSSMINEFFPSQDIFTQEVSEWSGKGMHTTTFAQMYDFEDNGKLIDTPGIRELGLVDIKKSELNGYFPEMKKMINQCKFNNCMHLNEPNCAVENAVRQGEIAVERYISYMKMLETIDDKNY